MGKAVFGAEYCHVIVVLSAIVIRLPKQLRGPVHFLGRAAVGLLRFRAGDQS